MRIGMSGRTRKALFNEFRCQLRAEETAFAPATTAPAVLVLNAFNAGGAQLGGARSAAETEAADDLDIAVGRHAIRTGFLIDAGRYATTERRNTGGTFTFASLDAYRRRSADDVRMQRRRSARERCCRCRPASTSRTTTGRERI